jgi:hypothetical protein
MTELTRMKRAYRTWCEATFPNFDPKDFPYSGRMWQVWEAAWRAARPAPGRI